MEILHHLQHGHTGLLVSHVHGCVLGSQKSAGAQERINRQGQHTHDTHSEQELEDRSTAGAGFRSHMSEVRTESMVTE